MIKNHETQAQLLHKRDVEVRGVHELGFKTSALGHAEEGLASLPRDGVCQVGWTRQSPAFEAPNAIPIAGMGCRAVCSPGECWLLSPVLT